MIKKDFVKLGDKNECLICNDKLNRSKHIIPLTTLLSNVGNEDSFVMTVSAPYGGGKTFFVKMWQNYLKEQNGHTLYYNAWENDFSINPLASFISCFSELDDVDPKLKDKVKALTTAAQKITLTKIPEICVRLLGALCKKYLDIEAQELYDTAKISAEFVDEAEKEVGKLSAKAKTMIANEKELRYAIADFKKKLKELITSFERTNKRISGKLVIFIDDLDRCRPDYAITFLEYIKHLFSIPNCNFVLSVDEDQLISTIEKVYGSKNAEGFLSKIIDFDFNLPYPGSVREFIELAIKKLNWESDNIFSSPYQDIDMKEIFILMFEPLVKLLSLTMRDIEHVLQDLNIIYRSIELEQLAPIHLAIVYTIDKYAFKLGCKNSDKKQLFKEVYGKISNFAEANYVKEGRYLYNGIDETKIVNPNSSLNDFLRFITNVSLKAEIQLTQVVKTLPKSIRNDIFYETHMEPLWIKFNQQIEDVFTSDEAFDIEENAASNF
ncbi:MAG TPA: hypothetical protein IAD20_07570 [Candidatus Scatocola faecipullorum]|jgi:KAP P-loop domain protein|uniref:KAP NTPase domain-containing protein n=1 Tax=Candidatus Scatocola faecipullorum TaxID=2840917 RepID=A0A9D1M4Z9_9PROT|nr:hypothetical protein [Candidatus Scatocola faecipullorum]